MADDEEVVFENSALFKHLNELGYGDQFDAQAHKHDYVPPEEEPKKTSKDKRSSKKRQRSQPSSVLSQFKTAFRHYLWDDSWDDQVQHLHQKHADELTDKILKHPALEDEDAAYIEGIAVSVSDGQNNENEDNVTGHILTQMSVLGVSLAYGFFRMMYMKSSEWSHRLYVWGLDILAILLTIVTMLPTTVKMASAGKLVRTLDSYGQSCNKCLAAALHYHKLSRKTVRLIQESELVSRGFTMVSPLTPVGRLEQGSLQASQRQCPLLRKVLFHSARTLMLHFKSSTIVLLQKFPAHVELEGVSNYLANLPLAEYGPCVNLQGEAELRDATDNYCVDALKAMLQLCNVHVSEFMRVWCLGCLLNTENAQENLAFADQLKEIESLHDKLNAQIGPLWRHYTMHKSLLNKAEQSEEKARRKRFEQTPGEALYVAVHSLNLHLQAALKRVQTLDDELDNIVNESPAEGEEKNKKDDKRKVDDGDDDEDDEDEEERPCIPAALIAQIASDLERVRGDLEACQDCREEGLARADRIKQADHSDGSEGSDEEDESNQGNEEAQPPRKEPINLVEMGDPIIIDQVFEAYTDPTSIENGEDDEDWNISEEERAKKRREKAEAVRMLKELRSVLKVRAVETKERETAAIRRQNPDAADTAEPEIPETLSPESEPHQHKSKYKYTPYEEGDAQGGNRRLLANIGLPPGNHGNRTGNQGVDGDEEGAPPDLGELKKKLAGIGGENFSFSADVAAMVAARSQQVAPLSEDTFGDAGEMSAESGSGDEQ